MQAKFCRPPACDDQTRVIYRFQSSTIASASSNGAGHSFPSDVSLSPTIATLSAGARSSGQLINSLLNMLASEISQYSQSSGPHLLPQTKSIISHVTSFTPASEHCMSSEDRGTAPKNHLLATHHSPTTRSSGLSRRALGATMKGSATDALYGYQSAARREH